MEPSNMTNTSTKAFDAATTLRKTDVFEGLTDDDYELISNLIKWKQIPKAAEVLPHGGDTLSRKVLFDQLYRSHRQFQRNDVRARTVGSAVRASRT